LPPLGPAGFQSAPLLPPQRGILLSGSFRTMSQSGACIRSDGLGISKLVGKNGFDGAVSYVTG